MKRKKLKKRKKLMKRKTRKKRKKLKMGKKVKNNKMKEVRLIEVILHYLITKMKENYILKIYSIIVNTRVDVSMAVRNKSATYSLKIKKNKFQLIKHMKQEIQIQRYKNIFLKWILNF